MPDTEFSVKVGWMVSWVSEEMRYSLLLCLSLLVPGLLSCRHWNLQHTCSTSRLGQAVWRSPVPPTIGSGLASAATERLSRRGRSGWSWVPLNLEMLLPFLPLYLLPAKPFLYDCMLASVSQLSTSSLHGLELVLNSQLSFLDSTTLPGSF